MQKIINLYRNDTIALRFIKFGFIGLSGVFVNSAILWILHNFAEMPIILASPIAIVISIFNNFSWNDRFTWSKNRTKHSNTYLQRLWKYYFSSILGALINYALLILLTSILDWHYLPANLAGILAGTVSNFLLGEFWIYKSKTVQY